MFGYWRRHLEHYSINGCHNRNTTGYMYVNVHVAYLIIIVRFINSQNVNELLLATSPLGRGIFSILVRGRDS